MAYAAKCDTAAHTKWWITGTGSSVNRLSEAIDANASGVEENDNPGNFQPWSEFMTETEEDLIYLIHEDFEVGDGSTSTTITSLNEMVIFDEGSNCEVKANATLQIGAVNDSFGVNGSAWILSGQGNFSNFCDGGTVEIYASRMLGRGQHQQRFKTGTVKIKNSILEHEGAGQFQNAWVVQSGMSTVEFEDVYLPQNNAFVLEANPDVFTGVHIHDPGIGLSSNASGVIATGLKITSNSNVQVQQNHASVLTLRDARTAITLVQNVQADSDIQLEYTCNIHVSDRAGANLQSVTVLCEDQADSQVFSVSTNSGGDIAEQVVPFKIWEGTSETLTTHSPHKFTLSKAGFETLILDATIVDHPLVWMLELQSQKQPPRAWRH